MHEFVYEAVRCLLAFLEGEQLDYFKAMPIPFLLPRAFDGDFCNELGHTFAQGFIYIRIVLSIFRKQGHTQQGKYGIIVVVVWVHISYLLASDDPAVKLFDPLRKELVV